MKHLVFVLMLLSTPAWAEWTHISDDDGFVTYADLATTRNGDTVRMWTLFDYKTAQQRAADRPFLSSRSQWEFDCGGKKYRLLTILSYSGRMGHGSTVYSDFDPGDGMPSMSEGHIRKLWKAACK
jgi:hypothetical protein